MRSVELTWLKNHYKASLIQVSTSQIYFQVPSMWALIFQGLVLWNGCFPVRSFHSMPYGAATGIRINHLYILVLKILLLLTNTSLKNQLLR